MAIDITPRHGLPLLSAGQAQKEIAHNEALALVDFLMTPVAESLGETAPPISPAIGAAWIVGEAPTGAWAGKAGELACWTAGGWRFLEPIEGMHVWLRGDAMFAVRGASDWSAGIVSAAEVRLSGLKVVGERQPAIPDPVSGSIVDVEARGAIEDILQALRLHGLISA